MSTIPSAAATPLDATVSMLKEATSEGIKAGVASSLAERLVDLLEDRLGDNAVYPALLKTALGRRTLSYVLPIGLYFLATAFPERIPVGVEAVKKAARYAVLGHSVKIVAPLLDALAPLWKELAAFSTTIEPEAPQNRKDAVGADVIDLPVATPAGAKV